MKYRCPSCPDGNEWGINGPTGRACKTCGGTAYIERDVPTEASPAEQKPEVTSIYSPHADTLNALVEMQESSAYAVRRAVLQQAESIICEQQRLVDRALEVLRRVPANGHYSINCELAARILEGKE
jgi:hypothetical protein